MLSRKLAHGVGAKRRWLPGMDSNHDNNNLGKICKLQAFQWSKMPHWTKKTATRTQLVHGLAFCSTWVLDAIDRFRFLAPAR